MNTPESSYSSEIRNAETKWTDKDMIEFVAWLRDNFSPLSSKIPSSIYTQNWLPKGRWRRDFTDEILGVEQLLEEFKKSRS